jgi:preprotein translocase subunit YajC
MGSYLILIVLLALVWFVLVLPSRRRRASHAAMQDSLEVGDEIITAGGLHATIRELDDEELRVEIAPGVVATLDRRAVAAVAREVPADDSEPEAEPEAS